MQVGMVGLGRMGANMVRRLMRGGHECVVHNRSRGPIEALVREGAVGAFSLDELVARLATPRVVWLMVPAAVVDATLAELVPRLADDDIVVDGGNSYYRDDIRPGEDVWGRDASTTSTCGTSGGVWGLERGYCLMIGGEPDDREAARPGVRCARARHRRHLRAPVGGRRGPARRSRAISTAVPTAPATSSRWSTTASSTASWPPMPRASTS